jgi:hypothetical protein
MRMGAFEVANSWPPDGHEGPRVCLPLGFTRDISKVAR